MIISSLQKHGKAVGVDCVWAVGGFPLRFAVVGLGQGHFLRGGGACFGTVE